MIGKISMNFKFNNAKADYLRHLVSWSNSIEVLDATVKSKGSEESKKLSQLFVMPDVEGVDIHSTSPGRPSAPASQLLNQNPLTKLVVLGDPGSGKTSLMLVLATMLAGDTTDRLPIFIDIRKLIQFPDVSILAYIHNFAEQIMGTRLPSGFFRHWLIDGSAVILLDGLDGVDEIADPSKCFAVLMDIERFLDHYRHNLAIITSRPAGYRRDFLHPQEVELYKLQPFSDSKVDEFINRWCLNHSPDAAEAQRYEYDIKRSLYGSVRLKMLARNPLLLTIVASLRRYQAALPDKRHKLYEESVAILLNRFCVENSGMELAVFPSKKTEQSVFSYLDVDDVPRLTGILAYWIHTSDSEVIDKRERLTTKSSDILHQLAQKIKSEKSIDELSAREEAERFVDFLQQQVGLLRKNEQGLYAFAHKTFQEYLCAQQICFQADEDYDFHLVTGCFYQHLHDPHWREVQLFLISQLKPKKAARVLRIILATNSPNENHMHRDLLFAGTCLAENIKWLAEADSSLVTEILGRLVDLEVRDGKQVGVRVLSQVFQILCNMIGTEFESKVIRLLREKYVNENQLPKYDLLFKES